MNYLKYLRSLSFYLVIVGALNWGLVGLASFDFVSYLFGNHSTLIQLVYLLVGVGGAFLIVDRFCVLALRNPY